MSNGTNIRAYNPSNLFAPARLVKARHVTEYSPAKTGCVKDLKDNKDNSLHLERKYAWIFVRFSEQIMSADKYPCIFWRQMATIVYIFSQQMAEYSVT